MLLAETIVGIAGNLTSMGLFLSPLPTFWKIYKRKSTEDFSSAPYLCTLLQSLLWLFYGSPWVNEGVLIMTINGLGVVIEGAYLIMFLWYARDKKKRLETTGVLATIVFAFAIIVCLTLSIVPHGHTMLQERKMIIGILCVIVGTIMYASPLSVMWLVIKTRSTQYMPLPLSCFAFFNGVLWTAYALIGKLDIYILIPNAAGVLLASIQLALYAYFSLSKGSIAQAKGNKDDSEQDLELAHRAPGANVLVTVSVRSKDLLDDPVLPESTLSY